MKNKLIFLLLFSLLAAVLQAQASPDIKWSLKTHIVSGLAFAPDDSYIVTGGTNNELRFYNVETGEIIDTVSLPGSPSQIKFTHDGKRMIVAIPLRLALVFDAVTHELIQTIDLPGLNTVAETISISYDDKYLTYGPSDSICIFSLDDYKPVKVIGYEKKQGQSTLYVTGTFTNDNMYVIVRGTRSFSNPNLDPENIFDIYDRQLNKVEPPITFPSQNFDFSNSGNYAVSYVSINNKLDSTGYLIWQYPSGNIIQLLQNNHPIKNNDFSKDDKYFAFSEIVEKTIYIYDISNDNLKNTLQSNPPDPINNLIFANTSNKIIACSYWYLSLFNEDGLGVSEFFNITHMQVVPQPSNTDFQIIFESSVDTKASIFITDINGIQLHTIFDGYISIGRNEFTWDTHGFASGTYFINIQGNGRNYTQQVILSK